MISILTSLIRLTPLIIYLEKAYDTTWKGGIMKDLHEMGLKGRLPLFIDNFLKGRKFKVRLDELAMPISQTGIY